MMRSTVAGLIDRSFGRAMVANAILNLDYQEIRSTPKVVAKPAPVKPVVKEPTLAELKLQLRTAEDEYKPEMIVLAPGLVSYRPPADAVGELTLASGNEAINAGEAGPGHTRGGTTDTKSGL